LPASKQELRPWYHSSVLLTNLFRSNNYVYSTLTNNVELDNTFRSLATVSKDKKEGGLIAVNRGIYPVSKTFAIEEKIIDADEIYLYMYNERSLKLGEDGYVVPNQVISGSLNKKITLEIPANTLVVMSTKRL
jgi:hypothetical protein